MQTDTSSGTASNSNGAPRAMQGASVSPYRITPAQLAAALAVTRHHADRILARRHAGADGAPSASAGERSS